MLSTHFDDQDAHGQLLGPPTDWPRRRRERLYSWPIGVKQNDPKNAFHMRQTTWKMVEFFFPNNTLSECQQLLHSHSWRQVEPVHPPIALKKKLWP